MAEDCRATIDPLPSNSSWPWRWRQRQQFHDRDEILTDYVRSNEPPPAAAASRRCRRRCRACSLARRSLAWSLKTVVGELSHLSITPARDRSGGGSLP